MTEENLIPPSEQPVRIRWLNAAGISFSLIVSPIVRLFSSLEQTAAIQKPIPQTPAVKTTKVTAPSVISKPRTKVHLPFPSEFNSSILTAL